MQDKFLFTIRSVNVCCIGWYYVNYMMHDEHVSLIKYIVLYCTVLYIYVYEDVHTTLGMLDATCAVHIRDVKTRVLVDINHVIDTLVIRKYVCIVKCNKIKKQIIIRMYVNLH